MESSSEISPAINTPTQESRGWLQEHCHVKTTLATLQSSFLFFLQRDKTNRYLIKLTLLVNTLFECKAEVRGKKKVKIRNQ